MWNCAAYWSYFLSEKCFGNDLLHFCKRFHNVSVHLYDFAAHLGKNWIGAKTFSRSWRASDHQKLEALVVLFDTTCYKCLDSFLFLLTEAKLWWDWRAIEEVKCFCLAQDIGPVRLLIQLVCLLCAGNIKVRIESIWHSLLCFSRHFIIIQIQIRELMHLRRETKTNIHFFRADYWMGNKRSLNLKVLRH